MNAGAVSRWLKPDVWILCLIAAGGFTIGVRYVDTFRASGAPFDFAQSQFGAAVAMACGHGFSDPISGMSPAYAEFLALKRDALSCTDLPAGTRFGPPNFSQGLYRYLLETASIVWRIKGISWSGLRPLFGLAYALTLMAAYGLFRLGMRPPLATAATLLLAFSAIHVAHVVYLRDYAKAPFILALMLITACFARTGTSASRRVWLSAAFGVTLGIGFGFRNDLLILLPAFVAVVAVRGGGLTRRDLGLRFACLATAALTFLVAAWPLVAAYSRGSNNGHVIMLGFMSSFDTPMGIRESVYDFGHQYSDSLAATLANSFSVRTTGASVPYVSREYDAALMKYVGEIVRNFPADIVTRAYASALKIFELPFAVGAHTNPMPYGIHTDWIADLYRRENVMLHALNGNGAFMVAAALVVIGASDLTGALLLTALVLYFAGYPAIQFHVRHFFHLEFITWWACGFLLQTVLVSPGVWRDRLRWAPAIQASAFAILAALMLTAPLAALRLYQQSHVQGLLGRYEERPKVALEPKREAASDGRVLFGAPALWAAGDLAGPPARAKMTVETEYLTATFSSAGCDAVSLPVTLRYESRDVSTDFSRLITIPFGREASSTSIMFAAFWDKEWSRFKGVELAAADAGCFSGLARTPDVSGLTLALNIMYFPDWRSRPLYQSIADWEHPGPVSEPGAVVVPERLSLKRDYLYGPLVGAGSRVIAQSQIAAGSVAGPWTLRGLPEAPYVYLVQYEPRMVDAGSVLVAEGSLMRGGLTIGLIRDNHWARYTNLATPGKFRVVIQPEEAGVFQATIANSLNETLIESRHRVAAGLRSLGLLGPPTQAVITRIGWSVPRTSAEVAH